MDQAEISDRLIELESRISRIEENLRLSWPPRTVSAPSGAKPPPLPVQPPPVMPIADPPPFIPYNPITPVVHSQTNVERTIGLKWAGWIGALVLVIGAGLGIQFAYEQGWFAAVAPSVRLMLLAIVGFSLIAAGEWVFRKITPLSAVGPFAAGIAVLFLTAYTGYAYYNLYSRETAFVLMIISILIGAAVAVRGDLVSIAVLSLGGGFLAPALLPTQNPDLVGFFVYLLGLQAVALFLAWHGRSSKWWTTRAVSLIGLCAWLAPLLGSLPSASISTAICFVIFYALLYQAELILTAAAESPNISTLPQFSTLVTSLATAGALVLLRDRSDIFRATGVLAWSFVAGLVSAALWRASKTRPAMRPLCIGFAVQAVTLFVLVIPIALSGLWIAAAWGLMALAFAVLAALLNLPGCRLAAAGVWALAVGKVFIWSAGLIHPVNNIWISLPGLSISAYIVMLCLLSLAGHAIAILIRPALTDSTEPEETWLFRVLAIFASAIWIGSTLASLPVLASSAGMVVLAALLILAARFLADSDLYLHATIITALASVKWLTVDSAVTWMDSATVLIPPSWPVTFNTLVGIAIAAEFLLASRGTKARAAAKSFCVLALLWIGTLEIHHAFARSTFLGSVSHVELAEQVALSIFWAALAVSSVIGGFYRPSAPLRYFGLGLFGVTILKVMLIDLSQVSAGYRILSFVALGALLLCTSVLYGKFSPRLLHPAGPEP